MSSVPVDAVDTHDDADLVQWLLASEMAQDVVFQSLVRGAAPPTASSEAASLSGLSSPLSGEKTTTAATSSASRFTSSAGADLALGADVPKKMVPPVELLEAESADRHAIRSEFETSIALFRHMHPAYVHQEYDWSLGGPRLTVARDRHMFSNSERHLPLYLQRNGNKKNFFSKELGHVMEVKSQLAKSYRQQQHAQQQQHQESDSAATVPSILEPAGRQQQQPAGKVIATHAFLAVPVSITHRGTPSSTVAPTAAQEAIVKEIAGHSEDSKEKKKGAMILREAYAEVVTLREAMVRHTLEQSEEFQRMQIAQRQQCDVLVAKAKSNRSGGGDYDARHSTSPMRLEFNWESTCIIARNVAPPRPPSDVQRHLPSQFRRPNTAGSQNQNRHPLTEATAAGGTTTATLPQKKRDIQSAGPSGPRPPPAAPSAAAASPPHAEAIPVLSVLPRAVAAYRVHSAPVHRAAATKL